MPAVDKIPSVVNADGSDAGGVERIHLNDVDNGEAFPGKIYKENVDERCDNRGVSNDYATEENPFGEEVDDDNDDGDDCDEDFVPRGKNDERTGTVKAKSGALPIKVTDKKKTDKNAGEVQGTPGDPKDANTNKENVKTTK